MTSAAALGRLRRLLRLRRREIFAIRVLAVLTAIAALGLASAWALAASEPAWWAAAAPADPAAQTDAATRLENAFASEASKPRSPDPAAPSGSLPWAVLIRTDDLAAWLSAKLPKWLAGRDATPARPDDAAVRIIETRVLCQPGVLTLGARVRAAGVDRVLWVRCTPVIRDDALWLSAADVSIGRLPAPASWVLDAADARGSPDGNSRPALPDALAGRAPLLASPGLRLHDQRRVRLLDIRIEPEGVVLTCTTEAPGR